METVPMWGISNAVWRWLIGGFLALHGLGHILYLLPAWGIAEFSGIGKHSWLLSGVLGDKAAGALGGGLWLATMAVYVAAGLGVLGVFQPALWRTLAIVGSVASLVGLALYFGKGPWVAPAIADAAILVALVALHWPPAAVVGA